MKTIWVRRASGRPGWWLAGDGETIGEHGETTHEQAVADAEHMASDGDEIIDEADLD